MKSKKGAIELSIGTIVIIVLSMSMLILGMVLVKNIFNNDVDEIGSYTFVLDGEVMDSIMVCEDLWHYELIDGLIPCVVNKTIGGIGGKNIDWTKSPQENCEAVDGEFTGFNLYNETKAKEQYDVLLPKCFEFKKEEISYVWLEATECECAEDGTPFAPGKDLYDCAGGLMVQNENAE